MSKNNKRLLVLASTYPRWNNDSEPSFVHELSKRLSRDFDVYVICPHFKNSERCEIMDGVNVIRFKYAPEWLETLVYNGGILTNLQKSFWKYLLLPFFFLAQMLSLARAIKKHQIDVIHAHWLIPQGLVVYLLGFFMKMPPFLVTSHGADLFALNGRVFAFIKKKILNQSNEISVVSEVMNDEIVKQGIDNKKTSVIPMGVDTNRFKVDPKIKRSNKELLFVGRLVEKKGLSYLINALPLILNQHPNIFLTIIGFGPEETKIKKQVIELGLGASVSFIGAVSPNNIVEYYQRASIFVAPFIKAKSGDQEGLGLVLVEALACGCPVIVSEIPACKDVLNRGGDIQSTNCLDKTNLAKTIIKKLEELSEPRKFNSKFKNDFCWELVSKKYARLLNRTAAGD